MDPHNEHEQSVRTQETSESSPLIRRSHRDSYSSFGHRRVSSAALSSEPADNLPDLDKTSWRKEGKVILITSIPAMITFFLQYALTVTSIFAVGHLGKDELGGVSLGMMSANITGLLIYQGLGTSLDTLCAQAYGSGKKKLVGLYCQRMYLLFLLITVPVIILWAFSTPILKRLVPSNNVANIASTYLKVVIFGTPGYALFECGKRFLQSQGLFTPGTYVMVFCAAVNGFLHWLLVWRLDMGVIGAPISVAITYNLLPLGLILYVYFVAGMDCWGGFSKDAFKNWGPMFRLGLPSLIALLAEYCSFEILTLVSSHISNTALAAQSVQMTFAATLYQIPFAIAIAGSTRIGNLVGASYANAAKTATHVTLAFATFIGLCDALLLILGRWKLPYIFNGEDDVVATVAKTMIYVGCFQLFDATVCNCNGILRGVGRPKIIGPLQLFGYYAIGLPISLSLTFKAHFGLPGLWIGIMAAQAFLFVVEMTYVLRLDFQLCVDQAQERDAVESALAQDSVERLNSHTEGEQN